ncbi:hypothetical protein P154DRAFT_524680 [Amniculicola lignicola CBS 123094]|uniref:C2H2-type domain-containing protein n=1 Tax=Amniculicola lignicola CBS 123094 TaxID=1392246 RepID=A0A6A5WA20_9PLEO|nr:hypothetical protein P154DRAFT_524680 [Amniculicola lignicola CBS 123094]
MVAYGIALFGCDRCHENYPSQKALECHFRDSERHVLCPECLFDAADQAKLMAHHQETGCRYVCNGCSDGVGKAWVKDSPPYWLHVAKEHVCTEADCGRHFDSESNLYHHSITHRLAKTSCLACPRKFTTYGGMLIHLEAGTCASDIDVLDLNKSAAMCFQWRKWIDKAFRDDLRDHVVMEKGVCAFKCPTCQAEVPKLSSLFMHAASPACGQTLNGGSMKKLKRWLWKRHHKGYHRA